MEVYRHVKTGGLYEFVACGLMEATHISVVTYRSLADGRVWVRPVVEFFDGRFVLDSISSVDGASATQP
jgi:hypothetical protein